MSKINYLSEPSVNSELILINNSKLLKEDESLLNEEHIQEIMELRAQYELLDSDDSKGLQKQKRDIRNTIRDLSTKTYTDRNDEMFSLQFLQIIDNMLKRPNFSGYSYKDEMKSLAIEHILKYTWRFDSYKQSKLSGQFVSAFTYISTIAFNAFVATINKQKSEHEKAKEEFLETQKLFHRETNTSTYEPSHSEIEKTVKIINIQDSLYGELQKIVLDSKDILVTYPEEYNIDLAEYDRIVKWSSFNKINLSVVKDIVEPKIEEPAV